MIGLAAGVGALMAACGSSGGASPDATDGGVPQAAVPFTEAEIRAASVAFGTKFCAAFAKCDPIYFRISYASMDECIGSAKPLADLLADYGYGSLRTPDTSLACTAALDLSTCEDLWRHFFEGEDRPGTACHATDYGTLADDSPCGKGNQCLSGVCYPPMGDANTSGCGRCVPRPPAGAPCTPGEFFACEPGSVCIGSATAPPTCRRFGAVGDSCGDFQPCHVELWCTAGKCAVAPADGACDPKGRCGGRASAGWCNPATLKCEDLQPVGLGAPCGDIGTQTVMCLSGGTCTRVSSTDPDAGADAGTVHYVCEPLIEEGKACDSAEHPYDAPCRVGNCHAGKCGRTDPAQCSPPPPPP